MQTTYNEYRELGLNVIPVEWDTVTKQPVSHRFWSEDKPLSLLPQHNAIMVKTAGHTHCLDFDLKNTSNKNLYFQWLNAVSNINPDLIGKLYVERTRNAGYHVWFSYPQDLHKLSLAQSDQGAEVIALYAGGPLVYTWPTPGYQQESGSMADLQELTVQEFDTLLETSQYFNEYKPAYDPSLKAVNYPAGLEQFCLDFDTNLSDESWQRILSEIDLHPIPNYRYSKRDKFAAYRRGGSESQAISAKVYYRTKRVMIFSASMHDYPNWHNKHEYPVWSLPPSFVLFYKCGRSWQAAAEQMQLIADAEGLTLSQPAAPDPDAYPMHVFPDDIRESILQVARARSLAPHFLATAGLWTVSSLAGTHYTSEFNGDAKNILFCLLIAPVSVGKTPAADAMCFQPLQDIIEADDRAFIERHKDWQERKAAATVTKQPFIEREPRRFIPFAVDGTTEAYVGLSMDQANGIGVYHDEAETILNAGAFKANNDAISFFTQAFSGGRFTQIRADRSKERVVARMNLNLLMGTQPSRLSNIFTKDRLSSGFASRFLMVESDYLMLNEQVDPFDKSKAMCDEWRDLVMYLYRSGQAYNGGDMERIHITMTWEAKQLYTELYRAGIREANQRILSKAEQYIIGTEAKMSAYFPRLVQILAIIHNPERPCITDTTVQHAHDLYKYYARETVRIIGQLQQEADTGLPPELELLYRALPDSFTRKEAVSVCERLNLSPRKFDNSIRRKDFKALFRSASQGVYVKV